MLLLVLLPQGLYDAVIMAYRPIDRYETNVPVERVPVPVEVVLLDLKLARQAGRKACGEGCNLTALFGENVAVGCYNTLAADPYEAEAQREHCIAGRQAASENIQRQIADALANTVQSS